MKIKNLVLTNHKKNFSKKYSFILLGIWCFDFKTLKNSKKVEIKNIFTSKEKIQNSKKLKVLVNKFFLFFFENLNFVHKKNYSERYWRILIGHLINEITFSLYSRYKILQSFFKKNNIEKINVRTFKNKKKIKKIIL